MSRHENKALSIFFRVGTGITVFAVAFFAAFLSSSHFMPVKKSNAETNGTYYANITSSGSIDISIDATPDGIGKVGKDTLNIDTNATAGYKLYLSTASGAPNNGLYLESDPTKAITATTGTLSEPSKLATNTWGFAPSRANDSATPAAYTDADADAKTGSAVFAGVPEYGSENIIYTNNSPSTAGTNSIDVYFGVNASTALDSGEYSNTVVYTAIVDAVNPSSENITLSPASQEGLDAGTEVTISTGLYPGFSADDLGDITVTIGGNACTNVTPSVAEAGNLNITCTAPAASAAGKYDVVVNVAKYNKTYTLTEGYEYVAVDYMQDFSAAEHAGDEAGTTYTLVDSRDKQEYTAAKLADGNIWMTENLELGGDTAVTLTPANSDVSSNYTLPAENTGTWCGGYNDAACIDQSLMIKTGTPNGYLYNWYAATAGTGTYSTSANQNAAASICPKGWKLPTKDQYIALDQAYGGNGVNRTDAAQRDKFMTSPLNFSDPSFRVGGSITGPGDANYWSRTTDSGNYVYVLYFSFDGEFKPQDLAFKSYGFAVRCVAEKTTLSDITNMQDMTPAVVANTAVGASKTLTDTRGGSYRVTKLADNKIWMTQNLRLVGPKTLTSADSNVSSDFTLTASNSGTWCGDDNSTCIDKSMVLDSGDTTYGTYYNWYAATAGTGTYSKNSGNATSSICPKGWHLPTSGSGGEFQTLYNNYNSSSAMMGTPAFVLSGNRNGSSTVNQGSSGNYWSSTADNSNYAYNLNLNSSNVNPQDYSPKYYGFTVRCVASS